MARRPLEGEQIYLDGGRRTTQLMRDSLGGVPLTRVTMRTLHNVLRLLVVGLPIGCNNPAGPPLTSIDQLTGAWTMDEYLAIDSLDAAKTRDMFTVVGFTWDTMVVAQSGAAILTYGNAGLVLADTAALALSTGTLTYETLRSGNPFGVPLAYKFTGAGNRMSWLSTYTLSVDVDNDGVADPVYVRMKWHRL